MSSTNEPQQLFVHNDKGKLWGPITLATLELLLDNGLIDGRIQLSLDGVNFVFPGRFPELRDSVPHELWGEGAPPPGAAAPAPITAPAAPAATIQLGAGPTAP